MWGKRNEVGGSEFSEGRKLSTRKEKTFPNTKFVDDNSDHKNSNKNNLPQKDFFTEC